MDGCTVALKYRILTQTIVHTKTTVYRWTAFVYEGDKVKRFLDCREMLKFGLHVYFYPFSMYVWHVFLCVLNVMQSPSLRVLNDLKCIIHLFNSLISEYVPNFASELFNIPRPTTVRAVWSTLHSLIRPQPHPMDWWIIYRQLLLLRFQLDFNHISARLSNEHTFNFTAD